MHKKLILKIYQFKHVNIIHAGDLFLSSESSVLVCRLLFFSRAFSFSVIRLTAVVPAGSAS